MSRSLDHLDRFMLYVELLHEHLTDDAVFRQSCGCSECRHVFSCTHCVRQAVILLKHVSAVQ